MPPSVRPPSTFLVKLYNMMTDPSNSPYCSFSPSGTTIQVKDVEGLQKVVLGKYFKTTLYSSFVRQLNMYNFSKIRLPSPSGSTMSEDTWSSWEHEHFVRGREGELGKIQRKGRKEVDVLPKKRVKRGAGEVRLEEDRSEGWSEATASAIFGSHLSLSVRSQPPWSSLRSSPLSLILRFTRTRRTRKRRSGTHTTPPNQPQHHHHPQTRSSTTPTPPSVNTKSAPVPHPPVHRHP